MVVLEYVKFPFIGNVNDEGQRWCGGEVGRGSGDEGGM